MGDNLPARSIQAMHQALGELSASLQQGDDVQEQEPENNAGNSFGAASYGGRQGRGGHGGPRAF